MMKIFSRSVLFTYATVFVFLFYCASLSAQQLLEDAIPTDYELITNNGQPLEPIEQYIVERGALVSDDVFEGGAGMGYESWHLTFTSAQRIERVQPRVDWRKDHVARLTFIGANEKVLGSVQLRSTQYKTMQPGDGPYYYELDLVGVSLLVLRDAVKIEIVQKYSP